MGASSRCCNGASGAGAAARPTVHARRSPSRSRRCRPGCGPRLGCVRRWRWPWRTVGISPRSPPRMGCGGPTVQRAVVVRGAVELVEPEPTRVLGMDETRFGRQRWLPDDAHPDGRSAGCARTRGRPGSSTSPVTRPCWGRSTAVPPPRSRRGWTRAPTSSGPVWRWW